MIHGCHVILPAYGFWLPNDPRGSWSDFVGKWELVRFGISTKTAQRRDISELTSAELSVRDAARRSLKYPPVSFTGIQALTIGRGFATACRRSGYTIWACSILPEHAHLVIARHRYKIEQVVNILKGETTRSLVAENLHPLARYAVPGGLPPRMWAERQWKVYLDSEASIESAIAYVEGNPAKEGKPTQHWSFVTPFAGIERGGWVTYH